MNFPDFNGFLSRPILISQVYSFFIPLAYQFLPPSQGKRMYPSFNDMYLPQTFGVFKQAWEKTRQN